MINNTDLVYISGPMSGLDDFNRPAFFEVQGKLEAIGITRILNPARHDQAAGHTWNHFMRLALLDMKNATAMVQLPGWENSRGARLEFQIADALGLTIIPSEAVAAMGRLAANG